MNWHFMKHNQGSITTRLVISLTVATTLLWCAGVGYASFRAYDELNEAFDAALRETALRLLPLAEDDALGHENDDARAIARLMRDRKSYLSYQLSGPSGKVLLRGRDAPVAPYDANARPGFSTVGKFRLYSATDPDSNIKITVAESMHNRREAVLGSVRALLWPLLALVPLNILAIWLSVRSSMLPVGRLQRDIAERGSQNLSPLDVSDLPKELRPIADAMTHLIERLRVALDAERAFAANSAHELRTPIAAALAQTQRLEAAAHRPDIRARASEIEQTLKRLARLADKLMQLSRADAGISVSEDEIDLKPILDVVVMDAAAHFNAQERIAYDKAGDTPLSARMDADAFAIAVRNLIDNALSHGRDGSKVDVIAENGHAVRVINESAVVPAETLEKLTKRFARGSTQADGSGLGLAIVDVIMTQAGGRLELSSPARGRNSGFEAVLILPADAP